MSNLNMEQLEPAQRPPTFIARPWPWPWKHPSIVVVLQEEERQKRPASWLDTDFKDDSDGDSDYIPPSPDSESESNESDASETDISDSEVAQICADVVISHPISPTQSLEELDEKAELDAGIPTVLKAEEDAAASYDPDRVVSVITQFYDLLITMGHWPEDSIRYPPHTDPPVDEELAADLGYSPEVISLMKHLPYPSAKMNGPYGEQIKIFSETRIGDYTDEWYLREGRLPSPYKYYNNCPKLDPWLLPLVFPHNYGWHVMLDTKIGVIRAYSAGDCPSENTSEWVRHGRIRYHSEEWELMLRTEWRRATIVPAARYFEELIYAYHSLSRLPVIDPTWSEPASYYVKDEEQEQQSALLELYRECGWPDNWQREKFMAEWTVKHDEIQTRWRSIRSVERGTT
ncbi:SWIM-type domain-containing protein [Favolaschia claudopus]|uniref:SWIM-type domain-containing protein n=1 Tax=Favolaschia claudopus TaxID=2862362 RepID=A0AAW0EHP6_9AGAR